MSSTPPNKQNDRTSYWRPVSTRHPHHPPCCNHTTPFRRRISKQTRNYSTLDCSSRFMATISLQTCQSFLSKIAPSRLRVTLPHRSSLMSDIHYGANSLLSQYADFSSSTNYHILNQLLWLARCLIWNVNI